ncbi:MAG TPA: LamG domain-containing protein [Candidatus Limnocylindrales bacterium]
MSSASDINAAQAMALICNAPVEVESLRSATGRVFANPDRSSTVEEYGYPQRVRSANGTWTDLNPTLVATPDGHWAPRASTVDMAFSNGGTGELVRARRDGREVGLTWPGTLARPAIVGNSATYPEVLPGVDLVVTASDTGFGEVFIVKTRAAAANPALRRLVFGSRLAGLTWATGDGGLRAVDATTGEVVLAASDPVMWDSGGDGTSDTGGPGQGARTAPVAVSVSGSDVVLEPDGTLLADPAAVLPMFIDPTVAYTGWTMINSFFPNQSYWSYDKSDCPSGYNTECAKVGYVDCCGPTVRYRSIWRFPTSGFRDKQILSAQFTIDLLHSYSCSNSTTELRETGSISSSTDWNNHASTWSGTVTDEVSNQSCNQARKLTEFSSATLRSRIQAIANGSAANTYWGLRAANEGSNSGWKKFDAKKAKLVVVANTAPDVPTSLSADSKACGTGSGRPFIKTATPKLRAKLVDDDGDSMTGSFEWAPVNPDGTRGTVAPALSDTGVTSGTIAEVTLPSRADGQYAYRAWAKDSHNLTGAKSGWCEFEVDTVVPAVPTVTADLYPEASAGCAAGGCGAVGMTGQFTFASTSADTQSYRWGFSDPPSIVATPATLGGSVTVQWTPTGAGPQTLFVKAVDRAGNEAIRLYQFTVAQPSVALARWMMNDAPGSTVLADDTGQGRTATPLNGATLGVPGRIAPGNDGVSRTAMGFDGVDDRVETGGWVIADTSRSFSTAAWVKLNEVGQANQHLVTQNGAVVGSFYLEYHSSGVWRLTLPVADVSGTTYQNVSATSPPRAGVWTHVAATYDSASSTARIYVNGVLEGTATGLEAWKASGRLRMGGLTWPLKGSLAEVQVWNRMISATEVFNLADPVRVGKVAEWRMEEVGPGPAFDGSGLAHDLTFHNGAFVPPSGAGKSGTGLRLDGVDDYAGPAKAVVRTDSSFTVSAWVRATSTTAPIQTYLAQGNTGGAPGFLMYYDSGNNLWKIKMYSSAALDESTATIAAVTATAPTNYHHLVGVFDLHKRELRLSIDGAPPVIKALNAAHQPWNSTGPLLIGRMPDGSKHAHADLDEIRVYQGAVADVTRIP